MIAWFQKRNLPEYDRQIRHIADDGEYTSDLAIMAAKDALNNAQISSKKIDYIIKLKYSYVYHFI